MAIPAPTSRYDAEAQKLGVEIAGIIGNATNRHDDKHLAAGIAKGFLSEHRTLQQKSVGVLLHALVLYAEEARANDFIDARNETGVKNILAIKQQLLDAACLPFI